MALCAGAVIAGCSSPTSTSADVGGEVKSTGVPVQVLSGSPQAFELPLSMDDYDYLGQSRGSSATFARVTGDKLEMKTLYSSGATESMQLGEVETELVREAVQNRNAWVIGSTLFAAVRDQNVVSLSKNLDRAAFYSVYSISLSDGLISDRERINKQELKTRSTDAFFSTEFSGTDTDEIKVVPGGVNYPYASYLTFEEGSVGYVREGKTVWTQPLAGEPTSAAASADVVLVSIQDSVSALNASTGEVLTFTQADGGCRYVTSIKSSALMVCGNTAKHNLLLVPTA